MIFRLDLDVALYRDRVQVTDRKTGLFVDHRAERAFSSDELLIADQRNLEHTLSHAIRKLLKGGFLLFQPRANVVSTEAPLTAVERQALRVALINTGFKSISFDESDPA